MYTYDLPVWVVISDPDLSPKLRWPAVFIDGKQAFPVFTDEDLAERFCDECELPDIGVCPVNDVVFYLGVLHRALNNGFTLVTFDPPGDRMSHNQYPLEEVYDEFADRFSEDA